MRECERNIKTFLYCLHELELIQKKECEDASDKKKKPIWLSKYNYQSLITIYDAKVRSIEKLLGRINARGGLFEIDKAQNKKFVGAKLACKWSQYIARGSSV